MGALEIFSILLVVAMVLSPLQLQAQGDNWGGETVPYTMGLEKMTKLHFYYHDNGTGDYPTAFRIAEAAGTKSSPTFFGAFYMIDDPLTEAQGFYGFSGQNEAALMVGMSLVFTASEKFNGSTISVLSRNPFTHTERELAIVGGTGYFQFARGFISAKTYSLTGANAIVEFNCTIVHSGSNSVQSGKLDSSSGSQIPLGSNLVFISMVVHSSIKLSLQRFSW
ncbi:hypothetical protein MKW94_021071 [Papaver nudicaule]|uniref:Dirigent protein n=1 Tax=Papaver nudicaule TaxID=74823 RepID=A0AA42B1H2_PAPNU|nr:hypothetical protein [Papaver nudicaule]